MLMTFLILIMNLSVAEAGLVNICLQNPSELKKAKFKIKEVLHPSDKVFLRESKGCLEFIMDENRTSLYNNYLKQYFQLKNLSTFSSENAFDSDGISTAENCKFELNKKTRSKSNNQNFQFGRKASASSNVKQGIGETVSQILVAQGRSATIHIDQTVAYIKCEKIGENYSVDVSLSQSDSSLSTSVGIVKGQRLNIGQIVRNLSGKDSSISLNKGLQHHKRRGESVSDYYLILK